MTATQRYLETGNSVCGTPPEIHTGLTREEEREVIYEALRFLAKTGFLQENENGVIIPKKVEALGVDFWICGYFTENEVKALKVELQKAYDEGGG